VGRKGADPVFKRAISLNPSNEKAHQWYAAYLTSVEKHEQAVEQVMISRDLDPLSSIPNVEVVREFYYARQYEQAIEAARKTELLNPRYARVHSGWAYTQMGKHAEAMAEAERAGAPGSVLQLTETAYAAARVGMTARSRELLRA
jgi:tetratricopeptide (TPR) repeat protein